MRIVQVISDCLPTGTLKQLELVCQAMRSSEHDVRVVSIHRERAVHKPQVSARFGEGVEFLQRAWRIDPVSVSRLRLRLRTSQPDVVHAWGPLANTYSCLMSLGTRIPIITSLRDLDPAPGLVDRVLRPWMSRRASRLVVNADYLGKLRLPARDQRSVTLIANGTPLPMGLPAGRSLHAALGLPHETLLIGCVGDLVAKKRLKDLIWALDLLRVIRPHVHLVIVGAGDFARQIRLYANQVSDPGTIHFLGHRTDIPELMSQFFCMWQASEREGCSNAILEAMALGVPVIAADTIGHRDLVRDNENGLLVALGDSADFARKTNLLVANREIACRLGQHAKNFVAANFGVDRMIEQFERLYNVVAKRPLNQRA